MPGYWVKIEKMDGGEAFLVTYSRGEMRNYTAFGNLDRALGFAESFIGRVPDHNVDAWGGETWYAQVTA